MTSSMIEKKPRKNTKSQIFTQSFLKTPLLFKKPNTLDALPSYQSPSLHLSRSISQKSLIFLGFPYSERKKSRDSLLPIRQKPRFSIQGFSPSIEQNVMAEFSYFQQISSKMLEKKRREFENFKGEIPGYYLPTLIAFQKENTERNPLVFLESLRKMCPFLGLDSIIGTRILLACGINPYNRFSPVSWVSFQRLSRVVIHQNASFDEKCEFLVAFFAGRSNFLENEEIPEMEVNGLLGKLASKNPEKQKREELLVNSELKEGWINEFKRANVISERNGLNVRKFRSALKRKVLDCNKCLNFIFTAVK